MFDRLTSENGDRPDLQSLNFRTTEMHIILVCVAVAIGCSDGREQRVVVTGTVTYQGKPVEEANVTFYRPAARPASGVTDTEGRFTLRTYDPNDGAVIGLHAVTISKTKQNPKYDLSNPDQMFVDLLPQKYSQPGSSQLTAEVTAGGDNNFLFVLTE